METVLQLIDMAMTVEICVCDALYEDENGTESNKLNPN